MKAMFLSEKDEQILEKSNIDLSYLGIPKKTLIGINKATQNMNKGITYHVEWIPDLGDPDEDGDF